MIKWTCDRRTRSTFYETRLADDMSTRKGKRNKERRSESVATRRTVKNV